jgi:mannosyltransferase OCH1-like enzyme
MLTLFTSYLCNREEPLVQEILLKWKSLNPDCNILYFSDDDIKNFFKETPYFDIYKQMKNGVAIADFFRICYINKYGGFWFDLDLEPFHVTISKEHNIQLFDCGFGNISYMFIGGMANQKLFYDIINQVTENIKRNIPNKYEHVIEITGPRVIQNIIFKKMNIKNFDGNFKAPDKPKLYLTNTDYEFNYCRLVIKSIKTNTYKQLQKKYNKKTYQKYNFV